MINAPWFGVLFAYLGCLEGLIEYLTQRSYTVFLEA